MKFPFKQNNILPIRSFTILLIGCLVIKLSLCFSSFPSSLKTLNVEGHFSFDNNEFAARDFGNRFRFFPLAVLHPKSVSDIATIIKHIWQKGPGSKLTVAARGHGHSLQGQAQAPQGIVINMESLSRQEMKVQTGRFPYVDVSAGELWIHILHECLFHGVLGGLGQFGIITRARISLEPAPKKVKWIRVLYSDFSTFARDQEHLISAENTFDYIEGLVMINKTGLINNWRSSFNPQDPVQASQFKSDGRTLFCLELTKNFNPGEADKIDQEIESLLSQLSYIPSTLFMSETSYVEFLDRVHAAELKLQSRGLWDLPHPWLNLLVPKSKINSFAEGVFGNILTDTNSGPVLVYPVNKSRWDNRTSVVLPEEDIFYLVAFLPQAVPLSRENDGLEPLLSLNKRVLDYCEEAHLGVKQYLPYYTTPEEWRAHFGQQWEVFVRRKSAYDPLAILAPGQRIFQKAISI